MVYGNHVRSYVPIYLSSSIKAAIELPRNQPMSRMDNVRLLLGLYRYKLLSVEHEVLQRIPESKQRHQHTVSDTELDRSDYRMGYSVFVVFGGYRHNRIIQGQTLTKGL